MCVLEHAANQIQHTVSADGNETVEVPVLVVVCSSWAQGSVYCSLLPYLPSLLKLTAHACHHTQCCDEGQTRQNLHTHDQGQQCQLGISNIHFLFCYKYLSSKGRC